MQPPITSGTILQNRYRIIKTLGQGGFGRTYLAEDQRRFNELCAIKELIPVVTGGYAWEKAKELFQREAAILYQIQHPQVPQFRERFEQDQRLFLVQDYVAGKTYSTLLDERKASGKVFAEQEVLQLIQSLLPILEHIHSRGMIHRDIAPDNIILRDSDRLPVLIDFGVVKELATRLNSPDNTIPATTVGKFGYAPSEQMQTGRAYPSSDLYALAVTAIVLLTGKEPQQLFDDNQLSWSWERWVTVNPQLAQVLNRMLSRKPSERYQSATEVMQALQVVGKPSPPTPDLSNVQTIAVVQRPAPVPPAPDNPDPVIPPPANNSLLDNPIAMVGITIIVIVLAGFSSWAFVRSFRDRPQPSPQQTTAPQTFPSPVIPGGTQTPTSTPTPTPTQTPTPTPTTSTPTPIQTEAPGVYRRRLSFDTSNTETVQGILAAQETAFYAFRAKEGQQLTVSLAKEGGVLLTILGPNREPIDNSAKQVSFYQGKLLVPGRYTIQITPVPGLDQSDYNLNVVLENSVQPTPTPSPLEPSSTPAPLPTEITPTPTPTENPPIPSPSPTENPPLPSPIPTEITPSPPEQ